MNPESRFFKVFIPIFLLAMITSNIVTFIMPESFAGTVRVTVKPGVPPALNQSPAYDPQLMQTTVGIIQSEAILDPVIKDLKLNDVWGRKYNDGISLEPFDSFKLLKARLLVSPEQNTSLVDITVYSEDRNEAAKIANAVANSLYANWPPESADKSSVPAAKIEIVHMAMPSRVPVKPDVVLNLTIGGLAGILLGSAAGGLAVLLGRRKSGVTPD